MGSLVFIQHVRMCRVKGEGGATNFDMEIGAQSVRVRLVADLARS